MRMLSVADSNPEHLKRLSDPQHPEGARQVISKALATPWKSDDLKLWLTAVLCNDEVLHLPPEQQAKLSPQQLSTFIDGEGAVHNLELATRHSAPHRTTY
eukprot:11507-Heterococcus_DN1.PRE.2